MAIQFARARFLSRSRGNNVVRSAAYNERIAITAERTGESFYFKHRDPPAHHEMLLPAGAAAKFAASAVLWNTADLAEKRKDAQLAREIVLALPANAELTHEDRVTLARSFAIEHFVSKGVAVQLDVHAPHEGADESERANWHAHLLITTRRIEGERLSAKKARDLDPEVRLARGRAIVTEAEAWGEAWRDHQNRYFLAHGFAIRVDPIAMHAQEHLGPVRMRRKGAAILERAETVRQANEKAARDPDLVLATLTRHNATFSEPDLDRYLAKHISGEGERAAVKAAVLGHAETLALYDRRSGDATARYTTRTVREQERAALADAAAIARGHRHGLSAAAIEATTRSHSLRPDQARAFDHAVAGGGFKLIAGRAGTGKSYVLQAVREAHERAGRRVVGLAPTNAVAQDLREAGFTTASTVHAELFRLKNGRTGWDRRTVLIIDEAAMLDSRVTGEVLAEARRAGAKVILAGDDRQLASIERGGLFSELRSRHRSAEITEITRQRVDWQRRAVRELAEGRFLDAVAAFDRAGAISWTGTQAEARAALVAAWKRDTTAQPNATRFVFAYTNRDVDALNAELRQVRRERGELAGADAGFETKHGVAAFAVGDRVQFTETLKRAHIYNGNVGTITGINAITGVMRARLDARAGEAGREVVWSADEFAGFRHGYAGTIYKGQGRTLDHTYLFHTYHWRSAASYVALTRQRDSAQVFVARETARNVRELARQMAREEVKAASLAWATADELTALRARAQQRTDQTAQRGHTSQLHPERADPTPAASSVQPRDQQARPDILIPPYADPEGRDRDSLGRGLDAGSIAAAVVRDPVVQREREALWQYLRGTYRDPLAAKASFEEMVKRQGWTSTAVRIARDPHQLGELRGKAGLFAGRKAKAERANALRVAEAIAPSLERIGTAEARAAQSYRESAQAQRTADATAIPKLTEHAEAAVAALATAADVKARADRWRRISANAAIAGELQRFSAAVQQRFGDDALRAMLRREGRSVDVASVPDQYRDALATVSRTVYALMAGEHAQLRQVEAARLAQRQALGYRQGLKP